MKNDAGQIIVPQNLIPLRITRLILIVISLVAVSLRLDAEVKALWLTAWHFNSPQSIDQAIEFAIDHDFSQILVHARYRSDALYQPNRFTDIYPNPEPKSYILADKNFDPLAYILEKTSDKDIEIHAWVTVYVATPKIMGNVAEQHIYHTNPDWITRDFFENKMDPDSYEGAYLDPGIPQVQDYLLNVFKDIVVNYDIKGLHLDYIRYPDNQFGYAEKALENYYDSFSETDFHSWKENQITRFVRRCYAELKFLKPEIIFSAAVISNLDRANNRYSQNWTEWLEEGIIDYAYTMTYGLTDIAVHDDLQSFERFKDRIVVGLRAWTETNRPFTAADVRSKVELVRMKDFQGWAMFSYSGLKEITDRRLSRSFTSRKSKSRPLENNYIFGYVTDTEGRATANVHILLDNGLSTFSDSNGFYLFTGLPQGTYSIKAETGIRVFFSDNFHLSDTYEVNRLKYDISFHF